MYKLWEIFKQPKHSDYLPMSQSMGIYLKLCLQIFELKSTSIPHHGEYIYILAYTLLYRVM